MRNPIVIFGKLCLLLRIVSLQFINRSFYFRDGKYREKNCIKNQYEILLFTEEIIFASNNSFVVIYKSGDQF